MYNYEFITMSDKITFKAIDDKVAIAVGIIVGGGKAGCEKEDGTSIPTMYLFHPDPMPVIEEDLGMNLDEFITSRKEDIITSLRSFAYCSFAERRRYDAAIEAITDADKLAAYKAKHEDDERTSMSEWVKYAWGLADGMMPDSTNSQIN